MLLLLPPSETKRDGGSDGSALDLTLLGFGELTRERRATIAALRKLSRNLTASAEALHLGPSQRFEIDRNRALTTSSTMPALDRYTGVLYDALDAASLNSTEREFAASTVAVHSALFGLVRAADPIPAYRLSHDSKLPGLTLRKHWREPIAATLAARDELILDLRSESYASLGPAPTGSLYLRLMSETADGQRKALNHFNKHGKGEFTRAVITSGIVHESADSVLEWAQSQGIRLTRGAPGELDLIV